MTDWFRLESVELGNSGFGVIGGDEVGVATKWTAPERQTPTEDGELRAWEAVKAGGPWRENAQSKREAWVGIPIAEALGVDLNIKVNRAVVYAYIQRGLQQGWLRRVQKGDESRRTRKYIEAGDRPSAPPGGQVEQNTVVHYQKR